MEETSTIKDIEEELKRLPESMATYNQLHEFEEMRAKRKQVKYRTRVKRILDRLKKRIKKQQEKQLKKYKKDFRCKIHGGDGRAGRKYGRDRIHGGS